MKIFLVMQLQMKQNLLTLASRIASYAWFRLQFITGFLMGKLKNKFFIKFTSYLEIKNKVC
jgi:hypothetical protein